MKVSFLAANTEHVVVLARLEPFLAELRQLFREPAYLQELEQLVLRTPAANGLLEERRRVLRVWHDQLMGPTATSDA